MEESSVSKTPALGLSTIHGLNIIWSFGIGTEPNRVAELGAISKPLDDGAYLIDALRAVAGTERRLHQYVCAKVQSLLRIEMLRAIRHSVADGATLDEQEAAVRGFVEPGYIAGPPTMRHVVTHELHVYTELCGDTEMGAFLRAEVVKVANTLVGLAESDTEESRRAAELSCVLYWKNWLADAEDSIALAQAIFEKGITTADARVSAERALTFAAHRAVSAYRELAEHVARAAPDSVICGQFDLALASLAAVKPNERTQPDEVHAAATARIFARYAQVKAAAIVLDERRKAALALIVTAQALHEQLS